MNRIGKIVLIGFSVLFLALPIGAWAADIPAKVYESGMGNSPAPVPGVKVEVLGGYNFKAVLSSGVSGPDGACLLAHLPLGKEFLVRMTKDGYVTQYDMRSFSDEDVEAGVILWTGSETNVKAIYESLGEAFDLRKGHVYLEINDEQSGEGIEGVQFSVPSGKVYDLGRGDYLIANAEGASLKVDFGKPGYAFDIESFSVRLFPGGMTQYYAKVQSGGAVLGSPISAAVTSVQVFGFIKTTTGAPISGASVAFMNLKGQTVRPTVNSASDGSYKQTEVPARKLIKIRVTKSPFTFKDKNVFIGNTSKKVDIVGK
jgi:hypothetical protein